MYRPGHYGVTLFATAPALPLLGMRAGAAFALLALAATMLPDLDTRTSRLRHRGPTHTLWFAVLASATGGAGCAAVAPFVGVPPGRAFSFCAGAFLVGLVGHLAADALNPGEGPNALRPFRPVNDRVVRLGVAPVDSDAWNLGLFAVGLLAQAVAYLLS